MEEQIELEGTEKALHDFLKVLADHPDLAERITITLKPAKIMQGTDKPRKKK